MGKQSASDFGSLLRSHRRTAGLTQAELADGAGISEHTIGALERGINRAPHKDTIGRLAEALHLPPEEQERLEAAARGRLEAGAVPANNTSLHLVRAKVDLSQQDQPDPPRGAPLLPTLAGADQVKPERPSTLSPSAPTSPTSSADTTSLSESTPLLVSGWRRVKLPRKRVALRLVALLVVVVSTYSGLSAWQHLWPFGKGAANTRSTPTYVFAQPTTKGGTITFSTTAFFDEWNSGSWNPWFIGWDDELELKDALWGNPYVISPSAALLPDELAEIPTVANGEVSQDGKTVIMRLRHDLRWSDGQPLTADDFAYWLEVLLDPALKDDIFSTYGYDQIASHQVQDAYTLVLHYHQPYAPFLYYLPLAAPKHAWGTIPHQELRHRKEVNLYPTVTSGPFKLESYTPGQSITMVPNPYYGSTTLHQSVLDRLVYIAYPDGDAQIAAFEAGQTDFAEDFGHASISGLKDVKTALIMSFTLLAFNLTNPVLQDYQVRKAIEEAIDRCELIKAAFQLPCERMRTDTILSAPSPAYDPTIKVYDFDLAEARKDMQIADWNCASGTCTREGKPFPTLRLLTTNNDVARRQVTELIKQDLGALGIPVALSYYPPQVLFNGYFVEGSLAAGQYDLALFANTFGLDNNSNFAFLHSKEIPSADYPYGSNFERLNDPLLDHDLELARMTFDVNEQMRIYKALQQQVVAKVYLIPLYHTVSFTLVNPNIGNQQNTPFWGPGHLWNVGDWFLIK